MSETDHLAEHRFHWLLDALRGYRRRRGERFDMPEYEVLAVVRAARLAVADGSLGVAHGVASLADVLARRLERRHDARPAAWARRRTTLKPLAVADDEDDEDDCDARTFALGLPRACDVSALDDEPAFHLEVTPLPVLAPRARVHDRTAPSRPLATACRLRLARAPASQPAPDEIQAMTDSFGAAIVAGLEICVRLTHAMRPEQRPPIRSAADMAVHFARALGDAMDRERFLVAPLDAHDRLIGILPVAIGTSTHVHVVPRDVLRPVILLPSPRFYVAHNHPSGELSPSIHDVTLTQRLCDAADAFEIELCDHLILGFDGAFRSLNQHDRCLTTRRRPLRAALAACDRESA